MQRLRILTAVVAFVLAAPAATWEIDSNHSSAQFSIRHMMISNVRGEFGKVNGAVQWDPANPIATTIDVTIDVTSINTRNAKRDAHLKSADFFDVEKYPTISYKSKKVERIDDRRLRVLGDLTMHGVTREVALEVEGPTPEVKAQGRSRMGAAASTKLNRFDFGLKWNRPLETGGVVVGDEVAITIDVELVGRS